MPPPDESGEDRLIAKYFRPLATHAGAFGLGDDAAALAPPPGCDVVYKADAIIGTVHFLPDDPPDLIARKALRVNLSDLAAKGAQPFGFLLSLALPQGIGDEWLAAFSAGLREDAERYGCSLLGGDTDRTPGPIMIAIAAFGTLPHGTMVRRNGAKPGDLIVVTGTIGDAALGLKVRHNPDIGAQWKLDDGMRDHLVLRYRLPQPRTAAADAVRRHASGSMDISDGLAGDLAKLCRASGVIADIAVDRLPLSDAARRALAADPALIEAVLTGGDDYEIVATVPPAQLKALKTEAAAAGVAMSEIGAVIAGPAEARFVTTSGERLKFARPSFSHFD